MVSSAAFLRNSTGANETGSEIPNDPSRMATDIWKTAWERVTGASATCSQMIAGTRGMVNGASNLESHT